MPAAGSSLVAFDAQLAKQQEQALQRHRGAREAAYYSGPKVPWEETGLYKALVKSSEIEEELVKIRNLIRKRTDPAYDEGDDDFGVAPVRKYDAKVDYYKLLEVDDFATARDIKGAYRRLALQYHPDKNRDKRPEVLAAMQDDFAKIQEAYEVLNDRATRRQYDRQKFDEARAKSQGMNMGIFSQGAKADSSVWERWSGERQRRRAAASADAVAAGRTQAKLPKNEDLRVDVWISLEKALRGGLKIREVQRDRMQRSFGAATKTRKTFHVEVAPGQADRSECRLEGEGHWLSLTSRPGDLVFEFRHKPHSSLRQLQGSDPGDVELVAPLLVKARVAQRAVSVWSPTFRGQMVLLRLLNPLAELAPSKACTVSMRVPGEGLPIDGHTSRRGALIVQVSVQLQGEACVASIGTRASKAALLRRQAHRFKHTECLKVALLHRASLGSQHVRQYLALFGKDEKGRMVSLPAIAAVWESPGELDPVLFEQGARALGWHAQLEPEVFSWCFHPELLRRRLGEVCAHVPLRDDELVDHGDGMEPDLHQGSILAHESASGSEAQCHGVFSTAPRLARTRVPSKQPEAQQFLMRFGLGPPKGFPDPGWTDNEDGGGSAPPRVLIGARPSAVEEEGEEEKSLTTVIRESTSKIEQAKAKWHSRRQRLQGERQEEEGTLRALLEKDRRREYDRIEKEMVGLRSKFEFEVTMEDKWMKQFAQEVGSRHHNEWKCLFKPAMVARRGPSREAQPTRRIRWGEVVKAKGPPTEDNWIRLEQDDWALTCAPEHGQLLQKWFGDEQGRYLELENKIQQRRENRNQTYLDYKKKRQEVSEWEIPPGPTEEEQLEMDDEEGEVLSNALEPLVREMREAKARLRELRRKRLEAAAERARKEGGEGIAAGALPAGFELEAGWQPALPAVSSSSLAPVEALPASLSAPQPKQEWERLKELADGVTRDGDWSRAQDLYTESLEAGGADLEPRQEATLLSNRALARAKLADWEGSLADGAASTTRDPGWSKGWLRRATAQIRLRKLREALASLERGFGCAGKSMSQLLPVALELEAALHADRRATGTPHSATPTSAKECQERHRAAGNQAFEQGDHGAAVLWYTRALYHRESVEGSGEAVTLSNRAAALLRLGLPQEALADALASSEKNDRWPKPLVRAGQAAQMLGNLKSAYQLFARARRLESVRGGCLGSAVEGLNDCLAQMVRWDYPAAAKRWARFSVDRQRPRDRLRVWALSDVFFDQHGAPEWCKSLSASFFREDVLMLAGNLGDSLPSLKFALTVLKSKFRRIFYVPGNHDLWVRKVTLGSIIKGEKVKEEECTMVDSVSKFLEVLQVCDELGVETAPAEVAMGVFVVPMFSWYDREFIPSAKRKSHASKSDAEMKASIDSWIKWPFPGGHDDAWKFFMRMNEAALRATLLAKAAYERFSSSQATVLTMTHFLTRTELDIDWTIPGIWDYIGCDGLDEQIRAMGSQVHVYGRACAGRQVTELEGVSYVHNYLGSTEKHRPGMAPCCVFSGGETMPRQQPTQHGGFNFQPTARPEPEGLLRPRAFGGG